MLNIANKLVNLQYWFYSGDALYNLLNSFKQAARQEPRPESEVQYSLIKES